MGRIDSGKGYRIRITERDKELIRKLSDYRLLSTEQIRYLLYPSINRARKRVLQLFRQGFLARYTRPVRLGEGSSQYLYRLGRKSHLLLSGDQTRHLKPVRKISDAFGEHALRTNDFRISVELASRLRNDFALRFWRTDRETKLSVTVTGGRRTTSVPLVPDGYFTARFQNKDFFFLVEIDRATAPVSRCKRKIEGYLALWLSKTELGKLEAPTFRLLWITESPRQLQRLLVLLNLLSGKYPRTDIVFLTTQDQVRLDCPEHILGKVWQVVSAGRDLPTSPFTPLLSNVPDRTR